VGEENIQYARNVMYGGRYGSIRSSEVYLCARDGMHVRYISTISASLTKSIAAMSAPFSKSRKQISLWPLRAALCNAVWPYYNNRERDRERDRER
jgi:hypothetical protein